MNAPTAPPNDPAIRLPLVIGVTGHRNLVPEDLPALRERIQNVFVEIRRDFRRTPLVLLSALAEGADRLVAEVAAKQDIAVVAPLPMPRAAYETDFSAPSRAEFAEWLDRRVRCWFELPLVPGNTAESIAESGPPRNQQYACVGEYIARHSQVLVALWDGGPGKEGGTQEVFDYKSRGFPNLPGSPRQSRLQPVEAALLYHIVTPRLGQPRPAGALTVKKSCSAEGDTTDRAPRLGAAATDDTFRRIFAPVDRYNSDAEAYGPALARLRDKSVENLLGDEKITSRPSSLVAGPVATNTAGAQSFGLRPIVERFALPDALAVWFQGRARRSLIVLYWLILLAMCFFEICAHEVVEHKFVLLGFVLLLIGAFGWHRLSRRRDDQNRYQDYRALAEGLRVQLFRRLAGLDELRAPVADQYLLKHATDLDWIRNALRTWSSSWSFPQARGHIAVDEPAPADFAYVQSQWVHDQLNFFKTRAERFERQEKNRPFASKQLVSVISVLVVLTVVLAWYVEKLFAAGGEEAHKNIWSNVALLLVSAILLSTALMHEYANRLALGEHVKTYRRMAALFDKADALLAEYIRTRDEDGARDVVQRLGREALVENGDWLILHRE